jgi:hypothetical protein
VESQLEIAARLGFSGTTDVALPLPQLERLSKMLFSLYRRLA